MNTYTKRIAASALVALLALSLSPTPIAPVAAEDEPPVKCYGIYYGPESVTIPGTGVGVPVPLKSPCEDFNAAVAPTGNLWAGLQMDENADRMGDEWQKVMDAMNRVANADSDNDGLDNIEEFWWLANPLDADSDDDNWEDGPEAAYWEQFGSTDGGSLNLFAASYAYTGSGAFMDTDDDGLPNMWDPDSDNDGLLDGDELDKNAEPKLKDTDGDGLIDGGTSSKYGEVFDAGTDPGRVDTDSDGADDKEEFHYWRQTTTGSVKNLDTDGDGLINTRDPDSDNDGLSDGQELHTTGTDPAEWDTDGDGMPDGWEVDHFLNPFVNDASGDSDNDGLDNFDEYAYDRPGTWDEPSDGPWTGGTNANDADTEGDGLMDGPEVLTHTTDPHDWDTDGDGAADAWELQHSLDALTPDSGNDPDADFFDQGGDGIIEQEWTNLHEYEYHRPASWDETKQGPWMDGTDPNVADTDGDGTIDGQEAYFGTDATKGNDPDADDDKDGLNWTEEANLGTNPSDPDTDGDGLCDGGRAEACTWPGGDGTGFQPGEADYGSTPWMMDSDDDGLTDAAEARRWDPGATGTAHDVDGDLQNGVIDSDSDDDGLLDGDEVTRGTDLSVADTDGDGLVDGDEVNVYRTNPFDTDTDSDGLGDGNEVNQYFTRPLKADTDGDGLSDGSEVTQHATDPLLRDTDVDGVPDGWEVDHGTQATVADAGLDPDSDGLVNVYEYQIGTHPNDSDSDNDGLPDGWEDRYSLAPTIYNRNGDPDGDGATNIQEFQSGADPTDQDTDGDGLIDGDELDEGSDPTDRDSDLDGLTDGAEVHTHSSSPVKRDTDGEGLDDYDEVQHGTDPNKRDTDGDGLDDRQEVFDFGRKYDPNDPDTNNDGYTDSQNAALEGCPTCDEDNDGLSNEQEVNTYGTQPFQADTDCDGAEDGPEVNYWNTRYSLSTYKTYLQDADVDGDGIKDGVEIGTAGTPRQVLYRTLPDDVDSDNDGLRDDEEATNNVKVACGSQQMSSSSSSGLDFGDVLVPEPGTEGNPIVGNAGTPLPEPTAVISLVDVVTDDATLAGLMSGQLYEDPSGLLYGVDAEGLFAQGGSAVRYYVNTTSIDLSEPGLNLADLFAPQTMAGPGTNGEWTDPELPDTDGDGLTDGEEVTGSKNPYKGDRSNSAFPGGNTDPTTADTDRDGILDGPEVGIARSGGILANAWVSNPNDEDTDEDGRSDGFEDGGRDGVDDLSYNSNTGAFAPTNGATSSPIDADTDDDGLPDFAIGGLEDPNPLNWDSDGDGLSDGLEMGVTQPLEIDGVVHTVTGKDVFGLTDWPTFQAFEGDFVQSGCTEPSASCVPIVSPVDDPDWDDDGIIDGLEDLNLNGIWGNDDPSDRLGRMQELHPQNFDTDNDGIPDGRELLLYGPTGGNSIGYSFADVMNAWNGDLSKLDYDSTNPFETNPLLANTDGDEADDGLDLNPRADAFLALEFGDFKMETKPDHNDWTVEMYLSKLEVDLPMDNGDSAYRVTTGEGSRVSVYSKGWNEIPDELVGKLDTDNPDDAPPSITGTMFRLRQIGTTNILRINLPDSGANLDLSDQKVTVRIWAKDYDWAWGNTNDNIDLHPVDGRGEAEYEFSLNSILPRQSVSSEHPRLWMKSSFEDTSGKEGSNYNRDEDGALKLRMGDNVPKHFLDTVLGVRSSVGVPLPPGVCYGGSGCV